MASQRRIRRTALDLTVTTVPDLVMDELVVSLETYVLAEHLVTDTQTFHHSWPASAWQAFKGRHPLLRRLYLVTRVKLRHASDTVEVKSWATFPESTFMAPELGQSRVIQMVQASSGPVT